MRALVLFIFGYARQLGAEVGSAAQRELAALETLKLQVRTMQQKMVVGNGHDPFRAQSADNHVGSARGSQS